VKKKKKKGDELRESPPRDVRDEGTPMGGKRGGDSKDQAEVKKMTKPEEICS